MIEPYLELSTLSYSELLIRVIIAALFGIILGWDRESKNKPIDFRAYIIVCITTCLISILALELAAQYNTSDFLTMDLSRVIAGTLTAIGFLGAGAIITKDNEKVIGTATGASVWAAGGFGLSIGFGIYPVAIIGFIAVALTLIVGGWFMEKSLNKPDNNET